MFFISEPKTFHDVIKPLVYYNCCAGIGVFRQPYQSDTVFLFMKLYMVIYSLFNWITIYITLDTIAEAISSANTLPMGLTMRIVLISANSFISVIAPFLVWLRRKGMKDCLRQMPILDNTFQTVFGALNEYRTQYIRIICRILTIILIMLFGGLCDYLFGYWTKLQLIMRSAFIYGSVTQAIHQPIVVMLMLDFNFCTSVEYVGKKFRDLNDGLLRLIEKPSNSYSAGDRLFAISQNAIRPILRNKVQNTEAEKLTNDKHYLLREIRKAHLELCKLSRKINFVFGIQNLLSTGVSFTMITGLLYTIYSSIALENPTEFRLNELFSSTLWTAIYAFKIWMINHSCSTVSSEVISKILSSDYFMKIADRTGEVIYELLNLRLDEQLEKEIQRFGVQMLQNPVRFNACGFFTLDYTFIQGVIGSVTTYLIILIQMSHVSESSTYNTAAIACNSSIEN